MSVVIEPANQLSFRRPLTRLVSENLTVKNTHADQCVAFKVKTTAPKQYCVRPNSGKIKPLDTVQIQVLLQPMKEDPPKDFKCKDKFLVQSVAVAPQQEDMPISELWSYVEGEARDKIVEHKVRCVFLEAEDGEKPTGDLRPESATDQTGTQQDATRSGASAQKSPLAGGATARKDTATTSREEELLRQLNNAQAQIQQLQQANELRLRRTEPSSARQAAASSSGIRSATAVVSGHQQFSIEVVALVAILSFLFGYLFF